MAQEMGRMTQERELQDHRDLGTNWERHAALDHQDNMVGAEIQGLEARLVGKHNEEHIDRNNNCKKYPLTTLQKLILALSRSRDWKEQVGFFESVIWYYRG